MTNQETEGVQQSKKKNGKEAAEQDLVHMTVQVPRSHRKHWQIEAKRDDKSLKEAISELLEATYGLPQR